MNALKTIAHCVAYPVWLTGQVIKESVIMAVDTLGTGRNIAPVVLYYPMRLTRERDIAAFMVSITMTPGTLALGVTGPKEVDYDAAAGKRSIRDASAVAQSEFGTHGLSHVQRFLAVHAMYGHDPEEILESLKHMEEKLAPSVRGVPLEFDVEHLVERGRPGPRGYRGSRGGRASDETVFDVEKVDPTPHASAFVSAILAQDEEEKNPEDAHTLNRKERGEVARRNAARAKPDVDSTSGDNLGASKPDQEGRTKPGETLYDPLYPKNRPKDDSDVDGSERWPESPEHWSERDKESRKLEKIRQRKAERKKRQEK